MVARSGAENVGQRTRSRLRARRYPGPLRVRPREYQARRVTSTDTSIAVAAPPEYVPFNGDTSA